MRYVQPARSASAKNGEFTSDCQQGASATEGEAFLERCSVVAEQESGF